MRSQTSHSDQTADFFGCHANFERTECLVRATGLMRQIRDCSAQRTVLSQSALSSGILIVFSSGGSRFIRSLFTEEMTSPLRETGKDTCRKDARRRDSITGELVTTKFTRLLRCHGWGRIERNQSVTERIFVWPRHDLEHGNHHPGRRAVFLKLEYQKGSDISLLESGHYRSGVCSCRMESLMCASMPFGRADCPVY